MKQLVKLVGGIGLSVLAQSALAYRPDAVANNKARPILKPDQPNQPTPTKGRELRVADEQLGTSGGRTDCSDRQRIFKSGLLNFLSASV